MSSERSPEFDAWVERARSTDILVEAQARGSLRRAGGEWIGPCPACGGRDRFAVNPRKAIFNCRGSGRGGDVIAMVTYLDACDFIAACSTLTGEPPPSGEPGEVDHALLSRRRIEREREAAERETIEIDYRERERRRAYEIWRAAMPIRGTLAETYLVLRRVLVPDGAPLRFAAELEYWHQGEGNRRRVLYQGPAMVAAITDDAGRFAGAHLTWLDPVRGGKATIASPETGEPLPAKKVRGSKRRGAIRLGTSSRATRLVIGEGIETVLSVYTAETACAGGSEYWSAVDLGHLGGAAAGSVAHPTSVTVDRRGRRRLKRVPGPNPALDAARDLMPDSRFSEIILLGDGDSDRFTTEMALARAAARWRQPDRTIRIAWAPPGEDFNDVLRRAG